MPPVRARSAATSVSARERSVGRSRAGTSAVRTARQSWSSLSRLRVRGRTPGKLRRDVARQSAFERGHLEARPAGVVAELDHGGPLVGGAQLPDGEHDQPDRGHGQRGGKDAVSHVGSLVKRATRVAKDQLTV